MVAEGNPLRDNMGVISFMPSAHMTGFDERILNGMGVFIAIVEAGSFVAAGERLAMSQPGVSRSVARLEARLGIRLFDRTTRLVALTDDGRRFYEQVVPLLAGIEEAAAMASGGATMVRGRLRVNIDPLFSRSILGPRIQEFLDRYPGIDMDLVTRDRTGDLIADGFDLAIHFGEPTSSSLVARKLLETRIVTVAAPAYLERHGCPETPAAIATAGHTCIEFRDPVTAKPFPWFFQQGRETLDVTTRGRLIVNDVGTMQSACVAGYGIAQMMSFVIDPLLDDGRLIDLFPDWADERFPLYALHPSRRHLPAKTRAFLDFVVALTSSLPGANDPSRGH